MAMMLRKVEKSKFNAVTIIRRYLHVLKALFENIVVRRMWAAGQLKPQAEADLRPTFAIFSKQAINVRLNGYYST